MDLVLLLEQVLMLTVKTQEELQVFRFLIEVLDIFKELH